MPQHIPNELALVRSTIHQADALVELLDDADNDSLVLSQIQSILETQVIGVDLLIELRRKLESNRELYKERAKEFRKYAESMDKALDYVDTSIVSLSGELGNRLEGSAESLCIQNNPVKVECLVDLDAEEMEFLCAEHPLVFKKTITVTYSYDSAYVKANQDKLEVHEYFNFTQGKHIRVRRASSPKALPKG